MNSKTALYYDEENDIAYFQVSDKEVTYSKVVNDDKWLDFAKDGSPVGMQIFNASKTFQFLFL